MSPKLLSVCLVALAAASPCAGQATHRWQVELSDASIIYEVRPVRLEGESLIFAQGDSTLSVPLKRVSQLRMYHKSFKHGTGGARATFGGVVGADDEVYQMTLLTVPEKKEIVEMILRESPDPTPPIPEP